MTCYSLDDQTRAAWKRYPIRISTGARCTGCGEVTVLVQSVGPFVTQTCPACRKRPLLSRQMFLALDLWWHVLHAPNVCGPRSWTGLMATDAQNAAPRSTSPICWRDLSPPDPHAAAQTTQA
jgi:hypothetical protein